jgi:hypothetical protein
MIIIPTPKEFSKLKIDGIKLCLFIWRIFSLTVDIHSQLTSSVEWFNFLMKQEILMIITISSFYVISTHLKNMDMLRRWLHLHIVYDILMSLTIRRTVKVIMRNKIRGMEIRDLALFFQLLIQFGWLFRD